jgi:hypothetical protein
MKKWEYITVGLGSVAALITIYNASKGQVAASVSGASPDTVPVPSTQAQQLAQYQAVAGQLQNPQPIGTGNVSLPDGSTIPGYNGTTDGTAPPPVVSAPSPVSGSVNSDGGSSAPAPAGCGSCNNKCGGSTTSDSQVNVNNGLANLLSVNGNGFGNFSLSSLFDELDGGE